MILVVDDDSTIVRSLRRALERRGYEVRSASNGVEAYELAMAPDCQCMLLDINMPKLNGAELLMLMQAEGVEVPTIVMAGFPDFDEEEMQEFSGVKRFFSKPFAMKEMLDAVDALAA